MKLGIIIPTYDNLQMLALLVNQIYDYTDSDFIVVVIEDGQKKATIDWLTEMQNRNSNFFALYNPKNLGVAPSWNKGLTFCQMKECDYFAIFNDDIEIPKDWWKTVKEEFEDSNIHLVSTTKPRMQTSVMQGWFFVLDKLAIEKVGYFDEQFAPFYHEDGDFIRRYMKAGLGYKLSDVDIVHHESTTVEQNINKNNPEWFRKIVDENARKMIAKHGSTSWSYNLCD